ncbi:MAG: dihydrodipicolinate synthase family protein [Rhodospirillales bacterium]|nr:dihydrodipicolinate synthase family protein [Rhodospirillales bacterium]
MMQDAIFGGVNAAILTPMRSDLSPDPDRLARRCSHLFAHGCDHIGVLGTTGEANSFGISERLAILEGLIERGVPAERLLPGTGTPAITDSVLLSRRAAELGCRGVLMLPPFYYKNPSDDGLFATFSEVIQRLGSSIPIYLYHFPQQSATPFSLALIGRLLKAFPGVIKGVKDSSGSLANATAMVKEFTADGFEVYVGFDDGLLDILKLGGAGCITAAANVTSAVNAKVVAHWCEPAGEEAQRLLSALRKALTSAPTIPALRALVAREEKDPAWLTMRPPHLALSPEAAAKFLSAWDACGADLSKAA